MSELSVKSLQEWSKKLDGDNNTQLAAAVLRTYNVDESLVNRDVFIKNTTKIFNNSVEIEGSPITNQKSSGRCWLFAATNVLRLEIMKKFNLKEFQFSQNYLFFFDKLEKCNFFLNQFADEIDNNGNDIDSRLIQFMLTDPTGDGGQFDMFINIVEKYGLVPHSLYPDTYSSTASRALNFLLKTKLREFAEQLKTAKSQGEKVKPLIEEMQAEIHRLMVIFLGKPPSINEKLTWEFKNKSDEVKSLEITPISFYKETLGIDLTNYVSLLNDPRNSYNTNVQIDKLGNVQGGKLVKYLNLPIEEVIQYAIKSIQNNKAIFFGTHTPIYMDKKKGIMDESLFNYKLIGFETKQSKASRIQYKQSLMTHAMVITAVHLDSNNEPIRWKVENSWGDSSGQNGYYVMDNQYFKDYVYQVVIDKADLSQEHIEMHDDDFKNIVLPPWDPMGALAVFSDQVELV
ncbi:peptidase C1B, bleomycin hydrolase [Hyphopichia burtonii NRRL Y-1933]|uniref:Cysteine proteinase 1, mitochondrial n=1 Tax=Hyphopichia burtonii NRRL Y-1933 TaxID=984485 RepID=A0A1E4RS86_9ASCO|nr:peptidase C1B, bleomycin hydrolase [Hyphopichia burtonii NRRL Y-1933]ODV70139.1 peptidase C1B, bleomycin hydrolase [Hyphopichia burtonii NRRL Y-1933]